MITHVATITSEIKRGFIRSLARQADAQGVSLEDALDSFQSSQFDQVKSGRFVASTANGSRSVTFSIPTSISQLQPDVFFALTEELCAACEVALAALIAADVELALELPRGAEGVGGGLAGGLHGGRQGVGF